MRTFRSLSILSSSYQSPLVFKSKFPNKKTFHPHFARSGLASLAAVTCRAAVVYGQGKPLQVDSRSNPFAFSLICEWTKVIFFPGWAGRGFASWTWRGIMILIFLSKPDMRMCGNPAGASSPCFCFNMPHWPLGVARRGPRHDGSFPHHTRPWRCLCELDGLFYHFCGSHLQGQGKLRPSVKEWVVCR